MSLLRKITLSGLAAATISVGSVGLTASPAEAHWTGYYHCHRGVCGWWRYRVHVGPRYVYRGWYGHGYRYGHWHRGWHGHRNCGHGRCR